MSCIHGCFVVFMTGQTGEYGKICRVGMTLRTSAPLSTMSSTVNREILGIVVKGGCCPSCGIVAGLTSRRKLGSCMRRIRRGVILTQMARYTGC